MNDQELRLDVNGDALFVTVDRAVGPAVGKVIVIPPFGMSGERMFPTAYLLTRNGFDVYRFDPRNHPGRSTGSIEAFTLSDLADDVRAMLNLVPRALIVAVSISSRAVIRALSERQDWGGAVLITPVVNVSSSLLEIFGADLFQRCRDGGNYPRINRILGYAVDMVFVEDCIAARMETLTDASADLDCCVRPVVMLAGTNDPWVNIIEVRQVAAGARTQGRDVTVVTVQSATHQLYRNPVLGMAFFHTAVRECLHLIGGNAATAVTPAFTDIISALSA